MFVFEWYHWFIKLLRWRKVWWAEIAACFAVEAATVLVEFEDGWEAGLLKTKNHSTKKMIPRLMSVNNTSKKIARGLLVTQSRPILAQHPSAEGAEADPSDIMICKFYWSK